MRHSIYLTLLLALVASSCNTTKYVKADELLYTGEEVELANPEQVVREGDVVADLTDLAVPDPNNGFKLWVYNNFGTPGEEKGFFNWLQRLFGEPPSLFEVRDAERSVYRMEDYLNDIGYFGSTVTFDTIVSDSNKVSVKYTMTSRGRYKVRDIYYPDDSTRLGSMLRNEAQTDESWLKSGVYYNLGNLANERQRLADTATNNGYYNFSKDFIYYFVDTITSDQREVDLYMRLEQPTDDTRHPRYRIGKTYLYPNYSLDNAAALSGDTSRVEDLIVIQEERIMRARALGLYVTQQEGDYYSEYLNELSINHLLDLDVFKFVNLKFEERVGPDSVRYLDRYYYLTPGKQQRVTASTEVSTQFGQNLGLGLTTTYTHQNLLKEAERLDVTLNGGVETQIGDTTGNAINTINLNGEVRLTLPRFYVPFYKNKKQNTLYVPRTFISLGANYQSRLDFFTLAAYNLKFGYSWRRDRYTTLRFTPVSIQSIQLLNTSDDFDQLVDNNPALRASFEDYLILGLEAEATYNGNIINEVNSYPYFQVGLETSGNLASLLVPEGDDGRATILGQPISQHVRITTEGRYYQMLDRKGNQQLIGRLQVGTGIPYGNSEVLPYIRQYFIGGANSVRAFQIRTLGPGSYSTRVDGNNTNRFIDQTGDIKLEANVEYRFGTGLFRPAVFIDAGNIWLINEDPDRPGGEFEWGDFYRELGVGAGAGLRLDVQFVVIRLDLAVALRDPSRIPENRWTFADGGIDWSLNGDLNLNIAIGYPF